MLIGDGAGDRARGSSRTRLERHHEDARRGADAGRHQQDDEGDERDHPRVMHA